MQNGPDLLGISQGNRVSMVIYVFDIHRVGIAYNVTVIEQKSD